MGITRTAANMINLGKDGSYGPTRDALRHQIWDTRPVSATIRDYTFFSQPIGAQWGTTSGQAKTKNETNLQDSGKLPAGQTLLVTRMSAALISQYNTGVYGTTGFSKPYATALAQAYINIMQNSLFEIKIAGRDFDFQIHGRQFLPALALSGFNGSSTVPSRNGDTLVSGWVRLDPSPIFLDSLVSFTVQQTTTNGDTTYIMAASPTGVLGNAFAVLASSYSTIQIILEGMLTRAK